MPTLSDRQRVELAIPAYLLCALTAAPGVFVPSNPDQAARAEADIAALRADLQAALLEPFGDLVGKKQHALLPRSRPGNSSPACRWKGCMAEGALFEP